MSKERFWEKFGCQLDSNCLSANTVFWQTIRQLRRKSLSTTTSINDSTGNILRNEKEILSRWIAFFEDLLNPVKATPTDTCNTIEFGKEVFPLTERAAAIRQLKSGEAAGEDEIQPEILKALNGEGVHWLTRVCHVVWNLGKTPKDWQTGLIISKYKKGDRKETIVKFRFYRKSTLHLNCINYNFQN